MTCDAMPSDAMPIDARTSQVLEQLTKSDSAERMTIAEIVAVLRGRAFALMLFLLGLPNCLPMPPPIALVSGFLLAFVALQMIAGFTTPWLPRKVLALSVGRAALERTLLRARPAILTLERLARPRFFLLASRYASRVMGVLVLLLSMAMIVAVPVIGQIPLGIGICLIGLGLVERDGLIILVGLLIGAVGVFISSSIVAAFVHGLHFIV